LIESFEHPGVLLFRGRELETVNEYFIRHPIEISKNILDLGCGEGYIGNMLFNKIDVGLDVIREGLEKAKKFPVYEKVILADARKMPFKDGSFDVIFSNSVIEHIKGIDHVLSEVSRILSSQGLFIFTVPSHKFSDYLYFTTLFRKTGLPFLGKIYSKARNRQLSHFNLFDDLEWERRLRKVSLDIVYKKYYLSHKEIYEWDKICILLRITKPLPFIYRLLVHKFYEKVKQLLTKKDFSGIGGGLLVVAEKYGAG